jgi:heme/copper-type cytochrome/quinol oxidase subunit 3
MRRTRAAIDVAQLPTAVFGNRDLMWWGTTFFAVIEAFTLALCAASYLYLRRNFGAWPPERTPYPNLLVPTISLVVLVIALYPAWWTKRKAQQLDLPAVRRGLVVSSLIGVVSLGLRFAEFFALNTRWDSHAYGSIVWFTVGAHVLLQIMDVGDTIGLAAISVRGPWEEKHFVNATDGSNYWYFMVLSWIPLFVLVFLGPRFL